MIKHSVAIVILIFGAAAMEFCAVRGADAPAAATEVTKVGEGLKFPEGPAWDGKGTIAVSNCNDEFISIFDFATGKQDRLPNPPEKEMRFGKTNGMTYGRDGALYACDFGLKAIVRITDGGKKQEVLADKCDGKPLLGPNDIAFDPNGNLYFTDPTGSSVKTPIGMVCRLDGQTKKVTKLADGLAFPNGIAFSADAKWLYVGESGHFHILRFPVKEDGTLGEKQVYCKLPTENEPDGMNFDSAGNLWVAQFGSGAVRIIDPGGKHIGDVKLPGKQVTNVEFAGPDLKTLYITECETNALYKVTVVTPGLPLFWSPEKK